MPDRHFYLLRHHILFYITFLDFCLLAPDEIRILCKKIRGFPRSEYLSTIVFLQFSKKFYYSGCLTSSLSPVKNKGIVQKYTISISNGNIQKKCVNPLDFNFLESHILLVYSMFLNYKSEYNFSYFLEDAFHE